MLDAGTKAQLKSYLERISQPIEIVASVDDSKASADLRSLLADVAAASPLIRLSESSDDNHRKPSFSVNRPSENHGPRFAGPPLGYGFADRPLPRYRAVSVPVDRDGYGAGYGGPDVGCTVEEAQSTTPAGWRKTVADAVAPRVPIADDQARTIIGLGFFVLSVYYVVATVVRAARRA